MNLSIYLSSKNLTNNQNVMYKSIKANKHNKSKRKFGEQKKEHLYHDVLPPKILKKSAEITKHFKN